MTTLKAPFPWFGGKSRAADLIWERFGEVDNYVEPFFGSGAVLLACPHVVGSETINDLDCYVANFWRALQAVPGEVASWADAPVNEADLHARHSWLVTRSEFRERMLSDPDYFDSKIAGWWVWGLSCWIGGGWCALRKTPWRQRPDIRPGLRRGVERKRPNIAASKNGNGVHQKIVQLHPKGNGGVSRQLPAIDAMCDKGAHNTSDLQPWFERLATRLRRVRVACGDWQRVLTSTPLGLTNNVPPGFRTAVLLDPPYDPKHRDPGIYASDGTNTLSAEVRQWAIANGESDRLRIALCGYEGEHDMPQTWTCVSWKAGGGYGNQAGNNNAARERIWFSPHCLSAMRQGQLFGHDR